MSYGGGFVKFHRSLLDWEWFKDVNTAHLWMYLILRANWKDSKFKGIEIKRGSLLVSLTTMADETGLTVKNVRTALLHLKTAHQVACQRTRYGMLINVIKYEEFQVREDEGGTLSGTLTGNEVAMKWQLSGNEVAMNEEYKEYKEEQEGKNIYIKDPAEPTVKSRPDFTPPTLDEIKQYCSENMLITDPESFFDYYQEKGWCQLNGMPIQDWQAKLRNWERKAQSKFNRNQTGKQNKSNNWRFSDL